MLNLALFVLTAFPVQDEELQTVHLPVVFCAVLDVLTVIIMWHMCMPSLIKCHFDLDTLLEAGHSTDR